MKIINETLTISTKGELDFIDLTDKIQEAVARSRIKNGLIHVFAPHATGVLILTEHESGLITDIQLALNKLVPSDTPYEHLDNAHAHIKSMLLSPSKSIPLINGQAAFGTWQNLFFVEVDTRPRQRQIIIQIIGE